MSQNVAAAPATPRKRVETVIGVPAEQLDLLNTIGIDPSDVSAGAEMDYTLLGIETDEGGYMVTTDGEGNPLGPDKEFEARPQMRLHYKIDDAGWDFSENPNGFDRIGIQKAKQDASGKWTRGKMRDGGPQQIFMAYLDQIGISVSADLATTLQLTSLTDLIGAKVHREMGSFPNPMAARDATARNLRVAIWTQFYGFDNDVRKTAKLPPMSQNDAGVWSVAKR